MILLVLVYSADLWWNIPSGKQASGETQHYTLVFNTFVWFQVFNIINSRRVNDGAFSFPSFFPFLSFSLSLSLSLFAKCRYYMHMNLTSHSTEKNIFEGLHKNWLFIAIILGVIVIQVIIVEFGGVVFHCAPLNWSQWLASVGIGFLSIPFGNVSNMNISLKYTTHTKHTKHNLTCSLIWCWCDGIGFLFRLIPVPKESYEKEPKPKRKLTPKTKKHK
jgi:magnesium-transporting ATPase (P-type)